MNKIGLVLLLAAACNGDDTGSKPSGDTSTPPAAGFTILGDGAVLPSAILSIWGSSQDDVFLVGGDDGTGPLVVHWDGAAWSRLDTGTTGDLWWVWSPGGDTVFFSGAAGRMVRYSRSAGTFTEETIASASYVMFGTWGTSETDVWSVGGDVVNGVLDGAIQHYDGTTWSQSGLATKGGADDTSIRQAFKVWGSGPDDVWVVGTLALLMHWDGSVWTDYPEPVYQTSVLTTVHGSGPDNVYAVGGPGNARVARFDGTAWADISPPPTDIAPEFNGVFVQPGDTVTCGGNGSVWHHDGTTWSQDERPIATTWDFHACWVDDAGAIWAVGGDLVGLSEGVVAYSGDHVPPISL